MQEIYNDYLLKHSSQFSADIPCMKKSLFYTVTREISSGSRKKASRAEMDYIKVNFHHDYFEIVEKTIDTVAPVLIGVKYQYDSSFGSQHQSVPETLHVREQKEVFGLYT